MSDLAAALVRLQKDLPEVARNATGQVGPRTYKYADLKAISDALLPRLAALGLAYTAAVKVLDSGSVVLRCSLLHESGQQIDSDFPIAPGAPQTVGAAITYGRRYCLGALTGLATEDDTDGAFADEQSGKVKRTRGKAKPDQWSAPPPPPDDEPAGSPLPGSKTGPTTIPPLSEGQMRGIHAGLARLGVADDQKHDVLSALLGRGLGNPVTSSKDLDRAEAAQVLDAIARREAELKEGGK